MYCLYYKMYNCKYCMYYCGPHLSVWHSRRVRACARASTSSSAPPTTDPGAGPPPGHCHPAVPRHRVEREGRRGSTSSSCGHTQIRHCSTRLCSWVSGLPAQYYRLRSAVAGLERKKAMPTNMSALWGGRRTTLRDNTADASPLGLQGCALWSTQLSAQPSQRLRLTLVKLCARPATTRSSLRPTPVPPLPPSGPQSRAPAYGQASSRLTPIS